MNLDEAPVIGPVGPLHDGLDLPFWEGMRVGELRLQRCSACRTWIWAPTWRCGHCGSWALDWEAVEPSGRVYSWIRSWQPFAPALANLTPFVTLLVELPHAGDRRLIGLLVGDETGLSIGAPVDGVIQSASALTCGRPILRWRLRPDHALSRP
jgi:uncharacterized OB-fold protein